MWVSRPKDEWVHAFVHTLDEIPQQWYVSTELRREIITWEDLMIYFSHTFSFADIDLVIHSALQHIHNFVLEVVPIAYPTESHEVPMMQSMIECYNITRGPDDEDDTRNINIP